MWRSRLESVYSSRKCHILAIPDWPGIFWDSLPRGCTARPDRCPDCTAQARPRRLQSPRVAQSAAPAWSLEGPAELAAVSNCPGGSPVRSCLKNTASLCAASLWLARTTVAECRLRQTARRPGLRSPLGARRLGTNPGPRPVRPWPCPDHGRSPLMFAAPRRRSNRAPLHHVAVAARSLVPTGMCGMLCA